jgi:hypothetical protein
MPISDVLSSCQLVSDSVGLTSLVNTADSSQTPSWRSGRFLSTVSAQTAHDFPYLRGENVSDSQAQTSVRNALRYMSMADSTHQRHVVAIPGIKLSHLVREPRTPHSVHRVHYVFRVILTIRIQQLYVCVYFCCEVQTEFQNLFRWRFQFKISAWKLDILIQDFRNFPQPGIAPPHEYSYTRTVRATDRVLNKRASCSCASAAMLRHCATRRMAASRPGHFTPGTDWIRSWVGPHSRSGLRGEKKILEIYKSINYIPAIATEFLLML